MNIKDKLKLLNKTKHVPAKSVSVELDPGKIANEILGDLINSADSTKQFIRVSTRHFLVEKYGNTELYDALKIENRSLATLAKNKISSQFEVSESLFVDTETTGLSGGSGTYVFLIGLGYFAGDHFVVEQYFLHSPSYEKFMLESIKELANNFKYIVSFNGKSFDIPLINTRCIQNRIRPFFDIYENLDLLHAARRIWKNDFGDCTLQTLEKELLDIERVGDISGSEIPTVYADFLKTGNTEKIKKIIDHNRLDILSMPALLVNFSIHLSSPISHQEQETEKQKRIAKLLHDTDQTDHAITRFLELLQTNLAAPEKSQIHFELGLLYKKLNNFKNSCLHWELALASGKFHFEAAIELVKYHEHRSKNYKEAIAIVERAAKFIEMNKEIGRANLIGIEEDLRKRKLRIQQKIIKAELKS